MGVGLVTDSGRGNQMPNAADMTSDKNLSFLLKGPVGFGKTIAASSFCLEGDILIAYFDKSKPIELVDYYNRILKRPDLLKRIDYRIYGAQNAHEYVNMLIDLTSRCNYVAVITDSVTTLTSAAVNWSLGFRNRAQGAKKDELNSNAVKFIPDFDEYKVETGMVTQALDICKTLPCHNIWTAHPLPTIKVQADSAGKMSVTKTNSIVSYGNKVAGLIPSQFQEIYHFSQDVGWNGAKGRSEISYLVNTATIGDEFAKTTLNLPGQFDITSGLFYEIWNKLREERNAVVASEG
jgi:hypothetical protein